MALSSPELLTFVLGVVLPALVALVTKQVASETVKSLMLVFLSGVAGVLTEWQDAMAAGVGMDWGNALWAAFQVFAVAVLTHFGLLKPMGVTGSDGAIQRKMPGGLG